MHWQYEALECRRKSWTTTCPKSWKHFKTAVLKCRIVSTPSTDFLLDSGDTLSQAPLNQDPQQVTTDLGVQIALHLLDGRLEPLLVGVQRGVLGGQLIDSVVGLAEFPGLLLVGALQLLELRLVVLHLPGDHRRPALSRLDL